MIATSLYFTYIPDKLIGFNDFNKNIKRIKSMENLAAHKTSDYRSFFVRSIASLTRISRNGCVREETEEGGMEGG